MQDLMEQFKAHLAEKDSSPETIRGYLSDLRKFVKWYQETEGKPPCMRSVGALDLAEFKRYLMKGGQKPATINRAVLSLSAFFNWLGGPNPAGEIKLLSEVKAAPRSLGRKEMLSLVRAVRSSGKARDMAIVTLLLHTGIRISELCALTPEDVIINERSGHITVRFGKGNKRREIPLNSTIRSTLKEWLDVRGNGPGALFTGKRGNSLSARAVEYLLENYSHNSGMERVTPHVLRHTFCKSLVDAGESLDRVAVLAEIKHG